MAAWPKTHRVHKRVARSTGFGSVVGGVSVLAAVAMGLGVSRVVAASDSLRFSQRGRVQATRALGELEIIAAPSKLRVFEPYEKGPAVFYAMPFNAILDRVYGKQWREQEEILFTCADGYQPAIPVRRLLDHKAWLAFDREDAPGFSIRKLESGEHRLVDLSPYYLIWENFEDRELRRQGDYGWPYQLVDIDLIRTRDRFPLMTPAARASPQVLAGFTSFRVHCTRCHAINGEGGTVGPELNVPRNPVEYRDAKWLRQWIDDPSRLLAGARMPALNKDLRHRDRVIDDILAYLGAISRKKIQPKAHKRVKSQLQGEP